MDWVVSPVDHSQLTASPPFSVNVTPPSSHTTRPGSAVILHSGGMHGISPTFLNGTVCAPPGMSPWTGAITRASDSLACMLPVGLLPGSQNKRTSIRTTTCSSALKSVTWTVPRSLEPDVKSGPVRLSDVSIATLPPSSIMPESVPPGPSPPDTEP